MICILSMNVYLILPNKTILRQIKEQNIKLCIHAHICVLMCKYFYEYRHQNLFLRNIHTTWSNIVNLVSETIEYLISSLYFYVVFFSHRSMELCFFSLLKEDNLTLVENYELIVKQPIKITTKTQPECPEKRQLWKIKSQ